MYGYNDYGYGLSNLSALAGGGAAFFGLCFLAFIAAIIVTVVLYRRHIAPKQPKVPGEKRDWGPFLRFDKLIIERLLEALYIFTASFIAFVGVAMILSSFASLSMGPAGILAILMAIVGAAIFVFVSELLNRLAFESTMLLVIITKNTTKLREQLTGEKVTTDQFLEDEPTGYQPSASFLEPRFVKGSMANNAVAPSPKAAAPVAVTPTAAQATASGTTQAPAPEAPTQAFQENTVDDAMAEFEEEAEQVATDAVAETQGFTEPEAPAANEPTEAPEAPEADWACPNCQNQVPAASKFCPFCGTPRA